ncbi:HAD family hydrolase [bacterium]|nr:MAG: HAD family hydrolase [bacterium]
MVNCVVFDLDDTLYDEIEYYKSGFRAVAGIVSETQGSVTHEKLYDVLWSQFTKGNHTTTFNAAFEQLGIACDDKFIRNLVESFRLHRPSIALPAETENVLKTLYEKYTLALLTDGYLPAQRLKVQTLGIEKYFQCIIYTEELGRKYWKPSTAGFEKILDTLKIEGKNCVYVADDPTKDFIAPNKLGFGTIQMIRPNGIHRNKTPDETAKSKYVIKSLGELSNLLKKI